MSRISIENIERRYGGVVAVRDVSLTVEEGTFVTLLGPSGSGKTTTLRMVAGLDQPNAGTISIGGRVVSGPGVYVPAYKREIGMVFQSYAVWPHMTVQQNVAFPLRQRKIATTEAQRRIGAVLEMVGLSGYSDRLPAQLSGGQQQRVALARAIVAEPRVILFDEPLSNLDLQLRDSLRILLKSLHRQLRLTAVYVTHDQTEAMTLSDVIHVMDQGRVIQSGTARDLYESPRTLFVAKFVGQTNALAVSEVHVDQGIAHLDCGLDVRIAAAAHAGPSRKLQLLIRPHWVKVLAQSGVQPPQSNVFVATVRQIDYLGDRQRYVLELRPGTELVAEVMPDLLLPGVGEKALVQLPPQHCRIV